MNLRKYQLKLNPDKCTFGVPAGKLLGFLVLSRGIEVNSAKIKAIERMKLPTCLKDVQKFTGCLASLSRFVSRLGEKALPLYQLMKKSTGFTWTPQADSAFNELKKMLSTAPVLASPLLNEPMLLYIAATNRVISVVIVVEREEEGKTVQRPVYYLSKVISTSKQNYPHYQKMTYGVYLAVKKLKHYFQEHPITVVCEAPIYEIIGCKDATSGLPNGQLKYLLTHRTMKGEMLSSITPCWISFVTGTRCNMSHPSRITITGRCTLMDQSAKLDSDLA